MKAVGSNVVVKIKEVEKQVVSGLTFPADKLGSEGLVEAVIYSLGSEVSGKDDLHEGDRILIYRNHGKKFTNPEDQVEYYNISFSEILVKL